MPSRSEKRAIALAYDTSMPAPLIVAKGRGIVADRIESLAAESGVPVVIDGALAAGLEPLDIGAFVPPDYWELVARVLVFISGR